MSESFTALEPAFANACTQPVSRPETSNSLPSSPTFHRRDFPPMSSSVNFTALEPAIASACAQHERENGGDYHNYRRCLRFGEHFVKFNDYSSFYSEVMTLKYVADLAKNDPSAPRVPQVLHFFHNDEGMAYAVMEYIEQVQVSEETLVEKATQAVQWMRSVPAPSDVVLGPKGNGRARHAVFKDFEAPLHFVSLGALERYLNKAIEKLREYRYPSLAQVNLANEPLVLTQSDMDPSNFGVDAGGRPIIFDFAEIGWLPVSLELYTFFRTTHLAKQVVAHLLGLDEVARLSAQPNLDSIGWARTILSQMYPRSLNLDINGYEIDR